MTPPPLPEGAIQQALFDELVEIYPEPLDTEGRRARCRCAWFADGTTDEMVRERAYDHVGFAHMHGLSAVADLLRSTIPAEPEPDEAQVRYLAHQARKREVLSAMLAERHSERWFADEPLPIEDLHALVRAGEQRASSCDRLGVSMKVVTDRDTKALLGGLLVGGVGWVHRAPAVIMLFADRDCYRAPGEVAYMPYLDAGVLVGHLYIAAAQLGLAGCFVNPNVRADHVPLFQQRFGERLYCGAYAVGLPRPWGAQA